jgi:cell division protein FtsI (penicillin-binding protein 3)
MDHYKGKERHFMDKIYSFGLHNKLGLDIKGEAEPYIKYPGDKLWSGISMPMIAHGYEVRLAPVHVLAFYNAVANNGKFVKPRFVKELRFRGRVVKTFPPDVMISSICSASTIRKARKMMEGVVEAGTARNLNNDIYKIAGKTGTAQIAKGRNGYRQDATISYQASFVGYFPADNPKYTCIVMVNAPSNGVYYGNLVAGPVFKEIADKVYASCFELHDEVLGGKKNLKTEAPYSKNGFWKELEPTLDELGIPYREKHDETSDWVLARQDSIEIEVANKKVYNKLVPDLTGMGAKDAVFLIESTGMRAMVTGWGKVTRQSVMPGSGIVPGGTVVLTLN